MNKVLLALLMLMPLCLLGQNAGKVSGTILNADDKQPLAGANVIIEGTSLGTASDEDGQFTILNVPVGTYTVTGEHIGFQSVKVSNISVSDNLTTKINFSLTISAIEVAALEIVADKPLINENTTNTTRIVSAETIQNLPVRGVESVVAMQTGTVADDDNIYVRGSRAGDVAYYVDGVYMNNAWDLENTSAVSNSAMEEVQFQSGGFSAEYGNVNGGVVNTTTKTGGDSFSLAAELVTGIGQSGASTDDGLYSYGYNLVNVSAGGPISDKVKYFINLESRTVDDNDPSIAPNFAIDRTEIDWSGIAKTEATLFEVKELLDGTLDSVYTPITYWTGDLEINGVPVEGWEDYLEHLGDTFDGTEIVGLDQDVIANTIQNLIEDNYEVYGLDSYDVIDVTKVTRTEVDYNPYDGDDAVVAGYSNFREVYGPMANSGSEKITVNGNLLFDLGAIRVKVGGLINTDNGHNYSHQDRTNFGGGEMDFHDYTLVDNNHMPKYKQSAVSLYTNVTYTISSTSYAKLNLSYFDFKFEEGDATYWDDIEAYGKIGPDTYLTDYGQSPIAINSFANFRGYGHIFNDYSKNETAYISLKGDYLNQMGDHEFKTGFDFRQNKLTYYRVAQPNEIAQNIYLAEQAGTEQTDLWTYLSYMNAYTENLGYSIDGKDGGPYYQKPGEPTIFGMYVNDKIELEDMIVNVGLRFDYFNANTDGARDWNDIWLSNGAIDREKSNYEAVDAETYFSPRVGFSFPVTDRTKFHAQYGKYTQHPVLNRLYLSDTRLAANFTQGNQTVSPNPSLKPERTTQYEVGFTQQLGAYAALDITGYYKEIRDYTEMNNLEEGMRDGSPFVWAQYQNGDFGIVKGLSFNLNMRRVQGLMANVSYTLSYAEGTGSDPLSNYSITWTGDTYPTMINPLAYDQRHTGSVMLDYRIGDDGSVLANSGANLLLQFGSGTAFTPSLVQSDVFGNDWYQPTAAINSAYKPWTSTVDLKLDHAVMLGKYKANVYLLVTNLFNTENVDEVYDGTGDEASDGYLSTQEGKVWATGNPDVVDFYNAQLRDPRNWDEPRLVRLGINFEL